jgi:hypothetical protein
MHLQVNGLKEPTPDRWPKEVPRARAAEGRQKGGDASNMTAGIKQEVLTCCSSLSHVSGVQSRNSSMGYSSGVCSLSIL